MRDIMRIRIVPIQLKQFTKSLNDEHEPKKKITLQAPEFGHAYKDCDGV